MLFIFLSLYRPHRRFQGEVFWLYVLLYSVIRFVLEFFRGDPRGFIIPPYLSLSQGLGILLLLGSLAMLLRLGRKKAQ